MSRARPRAERTKFDAYLSPHWPVHRLLEVLRLPRGRWFEPMGGEGDLVRAVLAERDDVTFDAAEIRGCCRPYLEASGVRQVITVDSLQAVKRGLVDLAPYDVHLTNPPYLDAQSTAQVLLDAASLNAWIVLLLRINFLGGDSRAAWLSEYMPDVYPIPNRPSFNGVLATGHERCCGVLPPAKPRGNDMTEYGFFVWPPGERRRRRGRVEALRTTPQIVRVHEARERTQWRIDVQTSARARAA